MKRQAVRVGLFALVLLGASACGPSVVRQPPGRPPTPRSVSVSEPGGDAADPHRAALKRLLAAPWGRRNDKDGQLEAPTPDWKNWKRVRYWGVHHFTGFRYGDEHHVIAIVFVKPVPEGVTPDADACMERFVSWARSRIRNFDVKLGSIERKDGHWRGKQMDVESVDGNVDFGFSHHHFSAAWATYPAYPDACLTYAIAVPWRGQKELAQKLRDRWVDEGFSRMRTLTKKAPHRQ